MSTHRHIWKDEGGPYVCLDDECGASLPATVVDEDSASQPGDLLTVVGRFASEQEAVVWLGQHPEQDKVERGGFGVDVPEPCCIVDMQTRGQQHHVTCENYR